MRVLLSRGVWSVIGAQLLLLLLWHAAITADGAAGRAALFLLALALAAFLYLTAGVSQAFANGRDVVGLSAGLRAGANTYGPFLWMIAKLLLLCGFVLDVLIYVAAGVVAEDPQTWSQSLVTYLPLIEGIVGFVFVYWLPVVFVQRRFALFETLRAGLLTAWERLPRAGYVAFLTLTPALLAFVLDDSAPLAAALALNVAAALMAWIAYVYCVEWLQDRHAN